VFRSSAIFRYPFSPMRRNLPKDSIYAEVFRIFASRPSSTSSEIQVSSKGNVRTLTDLVSHGTFPAVVSILKYR
jgi:hypothetical protein